MNAALRPVLRPALFAVLLATLPDGSPLPARAAPETGAGAPAPADGTDRGGPEVPLHRGRMYPVEPALAWAAVRRVAAALDLPVAREDEGIGLLVTKSTSLPRAWKDELRDGFRQEDLIAKSFELNFFAPPLASPARVYIGSITRGIAGGGLGSANLYGSRTLQSRIFESLERELGVAGEAIPLDWPARHAKAKRMLGPAAKGACWDAPTEAVASESSVDPTPGAGLATPPKPLFTVTPETPIRNSRLLPDDQVSFRVFILEDGFVAEVQPEAEANAADYQKSALGALSLWRFRPAMRGACAVPSTGRLGFSFSSSGHP